MRRVVILKFLLVWDSGGSLIFGIGSSSFVAGSLARGVVLLVLNFFNVKDLSLGSKLTSACSIPGG